MARKKSITYRNYTGGYNDTVAPYNMSMKELRIIENFDLKKTVGGLPMRKGTEKINQVSLNGNITRRIEYFLRDITRKVIVKDQQVFFDEGATYVLDVDLDKPAFLQRQDVLYISDNTDIYEYGQKDYFSNVGTVDILTDDIVQVADDYSNASIRGNFYKAKGDYSSLDLDAEDYTVTARWDDVTDIQGVISNVVRPVDGFDPSEIEKFTITLTEPCTVDGNIEIIANDISTVIAVTAGDSVNTIAAKISTPAYAEYSVTANQNIVTFTAYTAEFKVNPVFQPYSTGVEGFIDIITNGVDNDNEIDEIRKCSRLILHSKSLRFVASGNPDNPTAIYFSEPGQINYWKSINVLIPTSSDGSTKAMFNLLNSVIVSYNRTWWEYSGTDPAIDGTWKQLPIPFGCESEWTIQILSYYNFIYLAKDGLYIVSANILSQEGVPTQNTDALRNITATKVDNTITSIIDKTLCTSEFLDDVYYMAYNDEGTENNKVLCYFTDFNAFTKYTGLQVNDFLVTNDGRLEFGSKNYSIRTEAELYYDVDVDTGDQQPIVPLIQSTYLTINAIDAQKWFDKLYFHFLQTEDGNQATAALKVEIGGSVQEFEEIDITPHLVWGRNWGNIWGFEELYYYFAYLRRKGVWLRYTVTTETVGIPLEFYGITLDYTQLRNYTDGFLGSSV